MFTRASGNRSSSAASRGTRTPVSRNGNVRPPSGDHACPASAASTSATSSSAMAPARSVTRSKRGSWKAMSTPSRVKMDVGFEVAESQPHRGRERGQRVLGGLLGAAAMGKRQRAGSIQKRVRHRPQA